MGWILAVPILVAAFGLGHVLWRGAKWGASRLVSWWAYRKLMRSLENTGEGKYKGRMVLFGGPVTDSPIWFSGTPGESAFGGEKPTGEVGRSGGRGIYGTDEYVDGHIETGLMYENDCHKCGDLFWTPRHLADTCPLCEIRSEAGDARRAAREEFGQCYNCEHLYRDIDARGEPGQCRVGHSKDDCPCHGEGCPECNPKREKFTWEV